MNTIFARLSAIGLTTTLMAACTLQAGLEQSALDYNRAADRVSKQLLLLNAVRAQRGEGMTHTGISEMRGSFNVTAGANGTLTIPGAADATYGVTPSASYSTSPQIVIKPLATAEFTRGVSNAVVPQTIDWLWQQGWPREVVLNLAVEKVVLQVETGQAGKSSTAELKIGVGQPCVKDSAPVWRKAPDNKHLICVIENDPPEVKEGRNSGPGVLVNAWSGDAFVAFQRFLWYYRMEPYLDPGSASEVGVPFDADKAEELKALVEASGGSLALTTKPDPKDKTKRVLALTTVAKPGFKFRHDRADEGEFPVQFSAGVSGNIEQTSVLATTAVLQRLLVDLPGAGDGVRAVVHLRSPEGIIYYLGELMRAQRDQRVLYFPRVYGHGRCAGPYQLWIANGAQPVQDKCLFALFVGWKGNGAAEVEVDHIGNRYFVPSRIGGSDWSANKSLLAMAMTQLLFNLNTSREDLPSTQTVVSSGR